MPSLPVADMTGVLEALADPPLSVDRFVLLAAFLELLVDAASLGGTLGAEAVRWV